MSAANQTVREGTLRIWERHGWFIVPSWVMSLAFHAALLFVLAYTLPERSLSGDKAGDDRDVGIFAKSSHDAMPNSQGETTTEIASEQVASAAKPQATETGVSLDDAPPVPLNLPDTNAGRIGPGPALPALTGVAAQDLLKPSRTAAAGPTGGVVGKGGTSFFGGKVTGTRFVYVVDSSGSMSNHNAIAVAKAELLASLEKLDATQQFQIIFYNEKPYPLTLPGAAPRLLFATETNRAIAHQFVRAMQADRGTVHLDALEMALSYQPEAIFFLTDATEPRLDAGELDKIRRLNNGRAQIHCVQFDVGESLNDDNFLRKLVRQNGGTFTYRDVTKFNRAP